MANITHKYSNETKTFEIDKFDEVVKSYRDWIDSTFHTNVVISDEDTYKDIYKERTLLRKEVEKLKGEKKSIDDIILGSFDNQCSELVKMLNETDLLLTKSLEEFKPKEPIYKIEFKTKDIELYKKVVSFIEQIKGENENAKI